MSSRRYYAAVACIALTGCAANDLSLTITQFIDPVATGNMCTIDPASKSVKDRTLWDVDFASSVVPMQGVDAYFAISNNLNTLNGAPIETQVFYLTGFDVVLEPQGAVALKNEPPVDSRKFFYPVATVRLPPGMAVGSHVQVIAPDLAPMINSVVADPLGSIIAHIRPVATRSGDTTVGQYVDFPIELCKGCLTNAVNNVYPVCPLPKTAVIQAGNACNYSQDAPVTCCTAGQSLLCGASAPVAAM